MDFKFGSVFLVSGRVTAVVFAMEKTCNVCPTTLMAVNRNKSNVTKFSYKIKT